MTSGGNLYLKDSNQTQLISQVVELVATNNTPESLEDMVFPRLGKEEDYIVSVAEVGTDRGRKGAALFINIHGRLHKDFDTQAQEDVQA